MDRDLAYKTCARITRDRAGNFHHGIRLLTPEQRRAMTAVYAFARRIDDIGDGTLPDDEKRRRLERCRADLTRLHERPDDAVLVALADASTRFPIPLDAFSELIDGVERDLGDVTYDTFEELVTYCRLVAGTIGRLSLGVFGGPDEPGATRLADDLGVALQLTNILRDVAEDRDDGRVYLPAADVARFGADLATPDERFARLIRFEARRAEDWFERGLTLLDHLHGRSRACVAAMAGIYRRLLDAIADQPGRVLSQRVSLTTWQKSAVALRSLVRGAA